MSATRTALAAALLAPLLAACGQAQDAATEALTEQALEASTGQDVDIRTENGRQTITVDSGQGRYQHTTGEKVPLPEDFPDDITLPEDYTVLSVMAMGPTQSVVLRSDASMSELFEQIKAGQARRGWKETVSMQGAEGSMLGFEKGGRGVLVNLRSDLEGQTVVSLSLQAP